MDGNRAMDSDPASRLTEGDELPRFVFAVGDGTTWSTGDVDPRNPTLLILHRHLA